jgi:hypothetical protein
MRSCRARVDPEARWLTQHRDYDSLPYNGGARGTSAPILGTEIGRRDPPGPSSSTNRTTLLDPGFVSQRLSEATEEKSTSGALQWRIPRSSATRHPRGDCLGPEEGFYRRFPSSRRGIYSFTPLYSHTHRRWGRIGSRGRAADRARAVGAGVRDSSCTAGSCVRVRILPTLRQRCAIPLVGS